MQMMTWLLALFLALVTGAPAVAQTTLLSFDDLSPGTYGTNLVYRGYIFSPMTVFYAIPAGAVIPGTPVNPTSYIGITQTLGPINPDYLGAPNDGWLVVAREDGQRFTLEGLSVISTFQMGIQSSNSNFFTFTSVGAYSFSGPEWTSVERLTFYVSSGDRPKGFDNLVLTVVPEPSTAWLLAGGLVIVAASRLDKRRRIDLSSKRIHSL